MKLRTILIIWHLILIQAISVSFGIAQSPELLNHSYADNPNFSKKQYSDTANSQTFIRNEIVLGDSDINYFPFLRYKNDKQKYSLIVQPILTAMGGYDITSKKSLNQFEAGARFALNIKQKWNFETNLAINQTGYPDFMRQPELNNRWIDSTNLIPHFGKVLSHKDQNYTSLLFSGYLAYKPSKNFTFRTGIDKHFWGDGYRSLVLSDNSNVFPYFDATLNVWRLKYTSLIAVLGDINPSSGDWTLNRKYAVLHNIGVAIGKRINLNLFETIVWSATDSVGKRGFELNYLNPVIFYRPVEFAIGSPDNALLGLGLRYRIFKNTHLYTQTIIDEFVLSHIKSNDGWWGNKFGVQIGAKSFNFLGVNNLYCQIEGNYVRPYTYAHVNPMQNYGNHAFSLAHPYGGNFKEILGILHYQYKNYEISAKFIYTQLGADSTNSLTSMGNDIYKSYKQRPADEGIKMLQGIKTNILYSEFKLAYLLNQTLQMKLETGLIIRKFDSTNSTNSFNYVYAGFRTNFYRRGLE